MAERYYESIGRRKSGTARVRISDGTGEFLINKKPLEIYFPRLGDKKTILAPFEVVGENPAKLDVSILVKGGGITGQSGAIQLGIANALVKINPDFRGVLKKSGFLTRDPRVKERKKPGLKRARKAPTYTKR